MAAQIKKGKSILWGMACLILLNGGLSFILTARAKRLEKPFRECAQKRWGWVGSLEQLEGQFHRWEMFGSLCLRARIPLVQKQEEGSFVVNHLETFQPIVADSNNMLAKVPTNQTFRIGSPAWLCGTQEYYPVTIARFVQKEANY